MHPFAIVIAAAAVAPAQTVFHAGGEAHGLQKLLQRRRINLAADEAEQVAKARVDAKAAAEESKLTAEAARRHAQDMKATTAVLKAQHQKEQLAREAANKATQQELKRQKANLKELEVRAKLESVLAKLESMAVNKLKTSGAREIVAAGKEAMRLASLTNAASILRDVAISLHEKSGTDDALKLVAGASDIVAAVVFQAKQAAGGTLLPSLPSPPPIAILPSEPKGTPQPAVSCLDVSCTPAAAPPAPHLAPVSKPPPSPNHSPPSSTASQVLPPLPLPATAPDLTGGRPQVLLVMACGAVTAVLLLGFVHGLVVGCRQRYQHVSKDEGGQGKKGSQGRAASLPL